jgi:ferredoxin
LNKRKSGFAAAIPSEKMRIRIDKNLCNGCEACINHCPDVFMMWGMYMKADFEVADPEKYQGAVREAAGLCPKKAISTSG